MQTRQQQWAQAAFQQVNTFTVSCKSEGKLSELSSYRSFARSFPALIHECGLVQAIAFAECKKSPLLKHLESILHKDEQLANLSRTAPLHSYILLSQQALDAACWLKRYAEALIPVDQEQ